MSDKEFKNWQRKLGIAYYLDSEKKKRKKTGR